MYMCNICNMSYMYYTFKFVQFWSSSVHSQYIHLYFVKWRRTTKITKKIEILLFSFSVASRGINDQLASWRNMQMHICGLALTSQLTSFITIASRDLRHMWRCSINVIGLFVVLFWCWIKIYLQNIVFDLNGLVEFM